MDAIRLEMTNVGLTVKILEPGDNPSQGYSKSSGDMVYNIKMDLTRKGRWLKDVYGIPNFETSSYAGVV